MKAKFTKAIQLKRILNSISGLVHQVQLNFDKNGLHISSLCTSKISAAWIELRADGFESYECNDPFTVAVRLSSIQRAILVTKNNSVTLKSGGGVGASTRRRKNPLFIIERTDNKTGIVSTFNLDKEDGVEESNLRDQDTSNFTAVEMKSLQLKNACRDLSYIGDFVGIDLSQENGAVFSSEGELGSARISHRNAEMIKNNGRVRADFSNMFLKKIVNKATPLSKTVKLELQTKKPLRLTYDIPGFGHVRFVLAPKTTENDQQMED
jgi:proliferating cell nuclear antigen